MKIQILLILTALLTFTSCSKDEDQKLEPETQRDEIPFIGNWERQFEAGPGNLHTVNYFIYNDSIRYVLEGPIGQANYVMLRDTFLLENNRFIGHTSSNRHYLIFIKDENNNSIAIYKQEVADVTEGMSIEVPSETTTENHGWGIYHKQ